MVQILQFKYRPKQWQAPSRKKQREIYLAVPMWVALVAGIFYFEHDFGGVQSVNSPMGQSPITADHKFTFCGGLSQRYCVVDGDTIRFAGIKIRVADIDTPEIHDYKCEQELKRGLRAKSRLLELVNEGPFKIVFTGGDDADQYGRKLRRLMRNGLSLGELLIDEGLARRYAGGRRSWCV
jgi:endonuclease YncB( thermonuclease family)